MHSCPYTHTAPIKCPVQRRAIPRCERPWMGLCHGLPTQHWQGIVVAAAGAGTSTAGSPQALWYHPTAICSLFAFRKHRHSRSSCTADQTQLWTWGTPCLFHRYIATADTKTEHSGRLPMNGFINWETTTAAAQHFCGCWHTLLTFLRGWSCGRCRHCLFLHESATMLAKQAWKYTAL